MIETLHTKNIIFTSFSENEYKNMHPISSEKTVIYNCNIKQTNYGSIIVNKDSWDVEREFYPLSISHVIHKK